MIPSESVSERDLEILTKLVRLETTVDLGFKTMDKALTLARETSEREKIQARNELDLHLSKLNNAAEKIEKLEGTFATKSEVAKDFKSVNRMLYIGIGFFIAIEFIFKYVVR